MHRPWLIGILGFVALALLIGAYPARQFFKTWSAENLARSAEDLLKQGEITDALDALARAIEKDRNNYEVLRKRALIYSKLGHQDCLIIWTRLRKLHGLNNEDRREYAKAALLFGEIDLADKIMADAEGRNAAIDDILLRYVIAFRQGDYEFAVDLAREALSKDPDDQDALMNMAHALLLQRSPSARAEAKEILEAMREGVDLYSLTALRLLAADESTNADSRLDACDKILIHPENDFDDRLFAWRIQVELQTELKDEIVDRIVAIAFDGSPYEKAQIARFLNQIDRSERIAELMDFDSAKRRRDHLLIWLDSLAEQGLWSEIEKALEDPDIALEPFFKKLFTFRAHLEKGRKADADAFWSLLVVSGPEYEERLRTLADYVYKLRRYDYARVAYKLMSENSLISRDGYIGLVRVAKREKKLPELIQLLKIMVEKFPADEAASNEYNYYRLLARQEIENASDSAANLYRTNPKMMAFRITYALAYLRKRDAEKAYKLLNISRLNWEELEDLRKSIRAATLINTGQVIEAQELIYSINREELFPEELELIHPY